MISSTELPSDTMSGRSNLSSVCNNVIYSWNGDSVDVADSSLRTLLPPAIFEADMNESVVSASAAPDPISEIIEHRDFLESNAQFTKPDVDFLKLSAAGSKFQQTTDVIPSGFRDIYIFNSQKAVAPTYMPAVKKILGDIPAASFRTFEIYFMVKEQHAETAFSKNNVTQGR